MIGNQVVSAMFDVNTYIHMVTIVSFWDWNEDSEWLGFIIIISYAQVAFGDHLQS